MFGPNSYFSDSVRIHSSHRDKEFFDQFKELRELFTLKFGLEDYDVLFIPGSATVGIEAIMYSMNYRLKIIGNEGHFREQWTSMLKNYLRDESFPETEMFCRLESSNSTPFYKENGVVDAVSAFPYYDIPKGTKAFCTCLNKQLSSYIGLAVVCVKRDEWKNFVDGDVCSYLNLARYKKFAEQFQIPSTAPTFIFEHFIKVLKNLNLDQFRERIDRVSDLICSNIPEEYLIGDRRCPVITIKKEAFGEGSLAEKYNLYGYWLKKPTYRIFTYTSPYEDYEEFIRQYKAQC